MPIFNWLRSNVRGALFAVGVFLLLGHPLETLAAQTYSFTFSQTGFGSGASITGSFTGKDLNSDGWLESSVSGEILSFSMSYSGSIYVPAFSHSDSDFAAAGTIGGLKFKLGTTYLGDDTTFPFEGIASGQVSGGTIMPPPVTQFGYRTGYGPTGFSSAYGFVEDNSAAGVSNPLGNIDQTSSWAVVNIVPEPEIYAMLGVGLGFMGWMARRRKQTAA